MEVLRIAGSKRCALILGWTGSELKHLSRYSALWTDLKTSSVAATMTLQETFLPREETGLREKAQELVDAAIMETDATELIAHCFSNGGCLLYLTVLEDLKERHRLASADAVSSCIGTIYDSCPIPVVHPIWAPFLTLATSLPWRGKLDALRELAPYAIISTLWTPFAGNPIGWFGGLRDPEMNSTERPELVLYSKGDRVNPAFFVEKFVSLRRSQGVRVRSYRFPDDSPHVQHYRKRPHEYAQVVSAWLSEELPQQ